MRISQVKEILTQEAQKNINIHISDFFLYNLCTNSLKVPKEKKYRSNNAPVQIFPICIRQYYYSHMCLIIYKNSGGTLLYYDPNGTGSIPIKIREYFSDLFSINHITVENRTFLKSGFECVRNCLRFIALL